MLKLDFLLFSNHSYVFLPCQALIVWGVWVCTTSLTPRPTLWKENGLRTQTYTYTHTHTCAVSSTKPDNGSSLSIQRRSEYNGVVMKSRNDRNAGQ